MAVNLLFLFSCATAPKTPDPFEEETAFLPLEPGGRAYMLIDVPACRPILDYLEIRGMSPRQSREIFDRTRTAAAAFYPEGHERRFQAAAWGNYPGFRGNMALSAGKGWKKSRSKNGGAYYHSAGEGLSVALTASRAFVSGAGPGNHTDPFAEAPGTEIPEDFAEFRRGAALALWADEPGPPANRFFETLGIPLQLPAEQVFVSLFPYQGEGEGDAQYEALIRIQTPAASQARSLFTLINMARVYAPAMEEAGAALAALLFANPPVQDGRNLSLRTGVMSAGEIALLFELVTGQKIP
ncbi:MAG: hypothetical protein LBE14_01135 [Treponema sp.]|nr:hypothetical protein [Treponema sp.]